MGKGHNPNNYYLVGSDAFYLNGTALVLLSYLLEAPLRYVLSTVSLSPLIYLRDVMGVLSALTVVLSWMRGQRNASLMAGICALLLLHTLIGVLMLPSFVQPWLGLKTYMPGLLGLSVAPLLARRTPQVVKFAAFCFVVTALGVIVNYWVEFPWVGLSLDGPMGSSLELSKEWWTADGQRLPGFTRASYIAAQYMLLSLAPLLATQIRWWQRAVLIGIAGEVIWLTTTKGALSGLALVAAYDALTLVPGCAALLPAVMMGMGMLVLGLPLIGVQIGRMSGEVPGWAESFMERIDDMWPRAFQLFDGPASIVFGRGIGGIGMPQTFTEPRTFNAADNLMVFMIVCFGVMGPLYVGALLARFAVRVRQAPRAPTTRWVGGFLAAILGVGMTTGLIEEAGTCAMLFVSIGLTFAPSQLTIAFPNRSGLTRMATRLRAPELSS